MRYLVLFLAAAIIVPLALWVSRERDAGEVMREIRPKYGSIRTTIATIGTVQPQNRLEIRPPISGRVERVLVREGDAVRAGQILAWMSSTERAALLDAARAQGEEALQYWEDAYKPTPLIAPINGKVIVRAVEPGQTVTITNAIVVLSDRLIVKAQVDETDIGKVRIGQEAVIGLDAYPEISVRGTVDHISHESKVVNNVIMYEVDVLPERVPAVFRSGMSANVDIAEKTRTNVLLVPREAVITEAGGSFVLVREGERGGPVRRRVELGVSDDANVEVLAGLGPDDRVVITSDGYRAPQRTERGSPLLPFGRRGR
jgi:macrolide-specific efflux system membrane fusion protein